MTSLYLTLRLDIDFRRNVSSVKKSVRSFFGVFGGRLIGLLDSDCLIHELIRTDVASDVAFSISSGSMRVIATLLVLITAAGAFHVAPRSVARRSQPLKAPRRCRN